jgi:cytochrome c oxidase subunit I
MAQTTHDQYPLIGPLELEEMELYHPKTWVGKYVFSQDAKIIAIQYSLTAIAIGLVALFLSLVMRLQLGFPETFSFMGPGAYLQSVTMHGMIMVIYLLTALFLGGFGNYLIPLMVGARDMVFPYVNMLSYWVYLLAVLLVVASFFVPGGPTGAGWTLYPPQAISPGTPGIDGGILLMLLSLCVFIIGFTMGGLNYVVTVLQARTRGMTLMRMPLTVWGIFMATVLALLAFPALLVSCIMMLLDRLIGTSFFMPAMMSLGEVNDHDGGSPILWQHLFWFFGHPEVYIVALPAFGIVSDLLATHARKNIFGYRMMVWAILAIGGLSFVVWAHHMYVSGMNPYFGFFFATTTLIIAVPTAIKVYNWVLTLWRGNIRLNVPMLFAIGFVFTFINGGLTGLFLGNVTVDVPLSDTYFVIGHFHMVMAVSPILVIFGAIYHWYPKITGRMLNDMLGRWHFWITFVGTYIIYYPMHYLGFEGMPRRYFAYGQTDLLSPSAQTVNEVITIAALVVAAGQFLFIYNMIRSYYRGRPSGPNPWQATTLEWQTEHTPPSHGNFGKDLPIVYRWPYDYSVPGARTDFIPQNVPPEDTLTYEEPAYDPGAPVDQGAHGIVAHGHEA